MDVSDTMRYYGYNYRIIWICRILGIFRILWDTVDT